MSDPSTQPRRPSVKWDLGSDYEDVPRETTGSGTDFRRERLDSQPDIGSRLSPQIFFLRPRPPIQKLLFSLMNANDASVKKLLPRSHLSRVIIRDNLNAQRIYEMESYPISRGELRPATATTNPQQDANRAELPVWSLNYTSHLMVQKK